MKKFVVILAMAAGFVMAGTANAASSTPVLENNDTWEFYSNVTKPTSAQLASVTGNAELGKEAAYLYEQLKNLCVKRVPVVPGDPTTRIVFTKGDLFNAVRKIGKGLENDVKDKELSEKEASEKMNHVLNVAISAFYADNSQSFEKALRASKKDYKQLLALFDKVSLKE